MTGRLAYRLALLIVALIILAIISIFYRIKTGKPWSAVIREADAPSTLTAALVILLIIFGIFFIVNNRFFE